jgi:hypothetical protein
MPFVDLDRGHQRPMPCELTVEVIDGEAASKALDVIQREASEPQESEGKQRGFVFPSSDCEELRQTLAELLDREVPGWRDAVRLDTGRQSSA